MTNVIRFTFIPLALLILAGTQCLAQAPVNYNDVIVIVNDNSEVSRDIGAYFAEQRSIPERNIIHISVPTKETISEAEFQDLRSQIEAYMTANAMVDTINYMVTTKGMPLRINRETPGQGVMDTRASVENELTLILGPYASLIGQQGWAQHNYSLFITHYSRNLLQVYLVTRLDAYTKEDVFAMIDNSGPYTLVDKTQALFVMDQDPQPIDSAFHASQAIAAVVLQGRGWNVLLDTTTVYVTDQMNVMGYASWGSNDKNDHLYAENAIPRNTWSPGALAETFVSTSGRSFQPGTTYGQSLIADWLAEGVVGAKGYVFEPFTVALAFPHILFDRYTDESQDTHFNLAESFYMASRLFSWMEVVIGDPKTSIITAIPAYPTPSIAKPRTICVGDTITIFANNGLKGNRNWFRGDSATLKAMGLPFNTKHPLWLTSGNAVRPPSSEAGTHSFTYINKNITGIGFAQADLTVTELVAGFTTSADTVLPGQQIQFQDTTTGATERQWTFGDNTDTSPDTNPTHSYEELGTYTVTLAVTNGACSSATTRTIVVQPTTSVDILSPLVALDISPNPVTGSSVVSLSLSKDQSVTLRLFDSEGTLWLTRNLYVASSQRIPLEMSAYPAGAYILEVATETETLRRKIIKQQ